LARIIDLKNRKLQPQESAHQGGPAEPRVEMTAVRPHRFAGPMPVQQSSGLKPQESPPPPQVTPGPKTQVLSWSGPLYIHRPDMKIIAVVSLALFAIAALMQIFQKNIITTIFFGLLGVVILIRAGKKPEVVDFEINPLGVKVGEQLYGFREIKSFWIEYDPALDIKELSLQLKKWYRTYVKIPIYDQNPVQLRLILLAFLPEAEHEDTLADTVSRRLGL
jgi:hypothetical protein